MPTLLPPRPEQRGWMPKDGRLRFLVEIDGMPLMIEAAPVADGYAFDRASCRRCGGGGGVEIPIVEQGKGRILVERHACASAIR